MSVEVTCVTLPKDHCVLIPWWYINVCGYSDQFCKITAYYIHTTYILYTYYVPIRSYYVHAIRTVWVIAYSLSELSSGETKIFDKIYACNLVCGSELAFHYLFCQNSRENCMLLRFLSKNQFLPILYLLILSAIVNISKISRARLHYEVIVTSYEDGWYCFGIHGKRRHVAIHW